MAIDPVCEMTVDERTARWKSDYKETTYYFCAPGCKKRFDEKPEAYLNRKPAEDVLIEIDSKPYGGDSSASYACPMHTFIRSTSPSRCPECGMKLELMAAEGDSDQHAVHEKMGEGFKKRLWISTALTLPIILLSPMIQHWLGVGVSWRFFGDLYILFVLSSIVFIYGGWPFLAGLVGEVRMGKPGMMTLVAVAIVTAYAYSSLIVFGLTGSDFFWELATLIDIMLFGHWVEMKSTLGASKALEELTRLLPSTAHRIGQGGAIVDVPISELRVGDQFLVKPGEKIPADGIVVSGSSTVNEAMLTGESKPVSKTRNEKVIGGSVNGEGSLTVEVKNTGRGSFISQVIELVQKAQESKSRTQNLANRAALYLTFIALGAGTLTLFVWYFVMESNFAFALERTVTVMVITCPHALGLAIPLVVAVSTALAARSGLLIRNRTAFEKARKLQVVLFDKTGTLTNGKFSVTDVIPVDSSYRADEILTLAASVESHSEHLIAKAIVAAAELTKPVSHFRSMPGKGAEGHVDGRLVRVMSPASLAAHSHNIDVQRLNEMTDQGKTVVIVQVDDHVIGAIALADILRPESIQAIQHLKSMGVKCMMVTGDNERVAQWVANQLDLDDHFAEVLPQDKAGKVKEIQARGMTVAVVGDGVNDAPALVQADVGIAIGAGTDVAIEAADVVLVRSNPLDVVSVIHLSRVTYGKMLQNLAWAVGYNAITMPLAAGVLYGAGIMLSPAVGAILMSLSTVIVAINARMLKM